MPIRDKSTLASCFEIRLDSLLFVTGHILLSKQTFNPQLDNIAFENIMSALVKNN